MNTEQEEVLKWSCIEQAENSNNPGMTDGCNESEVYQAVNKMYEKCKEVWESDAKRWQELVNFCNKETMNFIQEKRTEQDAIDLGTKILRKLTELIEKD